MSDFTFIYALCEPDTEEIRYIGKANNPTKRLTQHLRTSETQFRLKKWIGFLKQEGLKPSLKILRRVPIVGWKVWESSFITVLKERGFNLINVKPGGNGSTTSCWKGKPSPMKGRTFSEEARKNMSLAKKGKPAWNKGKPSKRKGMSRGPLSASTKAKLSEAAKGRVRSLEENERMSRACKSSPKVLAQCKRMSALNIGTHWSQARREAQYGRIA